MSRVPEMAPANKPYKRLAWRIISDAIRQAKHGNVDDIVWLLTEGVEWLDGLDLELDAREYVNQIVHEAARKNKIDLLALQVERGLTSWQMII